MNGRDTNQIVDFTQRGAKLLASRHELLALGLTLPGASSDSDDELLCLEDLVDVSYRIDVMSQTLSVTAGRGAVKPTLLAESPLAGAAPISPVVPGIVLNYDLITTNGNDGRSSGGTFDMRAFGKHGVLSSGLQTVTNAYGTLLSRLNTTYTYSNPGSMNRYRIGDVITGGLAWTQPIRLGGFQFATDFSLRPDLLTYPVPSFGATAAVPSTVSVLVNGVQQMSKPVVAGPFDIAQIPVLIGGGDVSVVVTDALGRQVIRTLPFYASSSLLKPGLSSLSAEAGMVRLNYAARDDHYASGAGEMSYRRGIAPWLTIEGHGEGSASVAMGGLGATLSVGTFGVLSLAAAGSTAQGGLAGQQWMIGIEHINHVFSFSASTQIASAGFRDLASANGDIPQRRMDRASVGTTLSHWGSFGLTYAGVKSDNENIKLLSVSYSRHLFGDVSGYVTGFHEMSAGVGTGVFMSVAMPFGQRGTGSVGTSVQDGSLVQSLQASQSVNSVGDFGWDAVVQGGGGTEQQHLFGNVSYKSSAGLFGAGVDRLGRNTSAQLTAQGALAFTDGSAFATNTVQDSFAVVDTGAGVSVFNENRLVGKTGGSGQILVPDLRSYEINHIAIDPRDVPADADVSVTQREVVPQDRSAVTVNFPVRSNHAAVVRLVQRDGKIVPLGSTVLSAAGLPIARVGYGGQIYLENLAASNRITVTEPGGFRCSSSFDFHAVAGDLPNIGPVGCQ